MRADLASPRDRPSIALTTLAAALLLSVSWVAADCRLFTGTVGPRRPLVIIALQISWLSAGVLAVRRWSAVRHASAFHAGLSGVLDHQSTWDAALKEREREEKARRATSLARDMRAARRTALVLVLGLVVATAFATAGSGAHDSERVTASGDGVALTARHDGLKAAAVRLERDQRRDGLSSQRSIKHIVFAAFFVAVLALLAQGLRRTVATDAFRSPVTFWWFRGGGRAPPLLQPATV